jgi:ATP-dependent Clp protease ATP-binding subunit ClpB
MLTAVRVRLQERHLSLELSDAAKDWLVRNGYDETYGARPLKRLIQKEVENVLARRVLAGDFPEGGCVHVDVADEGAGETLQFTNVVHEPVEATEDAVLTPAA